MSQFLSRPLGFDFIQLEGLQKLTNVTAHEWDLYMLKELIDNALDADESDSNIDHPKIRVVLSYSHTVNALDNKERSLSITVSNQSPFPLHKVEDLFDLSRRVSVKFYNAPTRGAQGNALKTILGIPYALYNHYFSNYNLQRNPLIITYGKHEIVVKLDVDELEQDVKLDLIQRDLDEDDEPENNTSIKVNVRRFYQRHPRTIDDLMIWAKAFALFNPHATFDFEFIITNEDGSYQRETYQSDGNPNWLGKYDHKVPPPIHWYKIEQFRELVFASFRANSQSTDYTVIQIIKQFGFAQCPPETEFLDHLPIAGIVRDDDRLYRLYQVLREHNKSDISVYLGELNQAQLRELSQDDLNDPDLFFYRRHHTTNPLSETPFVLEVALYQNKDDKRSVMVGINHTLTYADPFLNKPLRPPDAEEPTKGIEKVLDHYNLREDTPISLIVHLIAPNIVYENYGKSAISDEHYRDTLTQLIDEVAKEYHEATRPPEPVDYLTDEAKKQLPSVIEELEGSFFSEIQLLFQLKDALEVLNDTDINEDLLIPTANSRLLAVINAHHRETPIEGLQKRQSGRLAVPRHDKDTINISFANISMLDIVQHFHVRAIIITNQPSIEDILIASKYTLRYDVAILRADGNLSSAIDLLVSKYKDILTNQNPDDDQLLPQIWLIRDATIEAIQQTRVELGNALDRYSIEFSEIVDLGLHPTDARTYGRVEQLASETAPTVDRSVLNGKDEILFFVDEHASTRLESLSPQKLKLWFEAQLEVNELSQKALPSTHRLKRYAVEKMRHSFHNAIADFAFEHYELERFEDQLADLWLESNPDWDTELHDKLEQMLENNKVDSWVNLFDATIYELLREFLFEKRSTIQQLMNDNN